MTELSLARYLDAVLTAIERGEMDCRMAGEIKSTVKVIGDLIRRHTEEQEIAQLREWRAELLGIQQQSRMVAAGVKRPS